MEVGDRVLFPFAGETKEGTIVKIFPKKVYIKADFRNHKEKIIKRAIHEIESGTRSRKKKRR